MEEVARNNENEALKKREAEKKKFKKGQADLEKELGFYERSARVQRQASAAGTSVGDGRMAVSRSQEGNSLTAIGLIATTALLGQHPLTRAGVIRDARRARVQRIFYRS